ncbi:hypothetical protein G6L15_08320 [Agrobacterium rhizogenes]|uniref:hypothetical protein n=1 Tax=Rhizobium rhizogenes TaxID=359 RepID=UPI00157353E1|nr:hypothetical protein [Rhizobium rhizogenes]NTG86149.1 hypothetical protein [Rhizobium rhizogenes]
MITEEMRQAFYSKADIQQTGTVLNLDEALTAALALLPGEPVGVTSTMPSASGFTFAAFKATDVPVGTRLYTSPTPHLSVDREGLLEEARGVLEWYASPEIYQPHPHGPAFDRRDLSALAKSFLSKLEASHAKA